MENAVLRGAGRYPCTLGNHVLIGPHAHIAGATVNGCAFVATGASVFNGAVLEQGVVVAMHAIVHVGTRCVAGTGVPIGHIALGDPATIYPPHEAPPCMPSSERWASRRPSSGLKRKAWRMRQQSRRFAKDMLGRYKPIETMRSWPSNGLRVGAVREQWPSSEPRLTWAWSRGAHARLMPGVIRTKNALSYESEK